MAGFSLSLREARRVALAAQGFDRARPVRPGPRHLESVLRRIAPLQLDFVNVLVPAHYLIPFSRLGPYRREALHGLIYGSGRFTEQWAHEAAVIPVETWPLLKHRMAEHRVRPRNFASAVAAQAEYAAAVLAAVAARGPLAAHELPKAPPGLGSFAGTWMGSFERVMLEAHFGRGRLASANRLANFTRSYDLAERRIPAEHYGRAVSREEAHRELLLLAARAHGVGTAHDLADYYRLNITACKRALGELAAEGALEAGEVEGWKDPAYRHPEAAVPRAVRACALLSPFDPLVWFRPRAKRLFGFDYRIEIYTPAAKRKYGYYVLPFLQGERLTARVDLKADRAAGVLRVLAAYHEDGAAPEKVAGPLAAELQVLAGWLGLGEVAFARKGNLAGQW